MFNLNNHGYTPRTDQEFWCNTCDAHKVSSVNKETGKFFVFFGHMYSSEEGEYSGDYNGVMFAICRHCL